MNTYRNEYNGTLRCDNIEYFPVSCRYNKFPLNPTNFTYTTKSKDQLNCEPKDQIYQNSVSVLQKEIFIKNNRERLNFKINVPQTDLVSFGIWGRVYTRDVDHNKATSEEDVRKFNTILDNIYKTD